MESGKPLSNPLPSYAKIYRKYCPNFDEDKVEMKKVSYASTIGCLMYAMIATCPDIAFVVGVVSR